MQHLPIGHDHAKRPVTFREIRSGGGETLNRHLRGGSLTSAVQEKRRSMRRSCPEIHRLRKRGCRARSSGISRARVRFTWRGWSQRRACELMDIARSGLGNCSVRNERDRPLIEAMKRLAAQYPRYGYRRIRVFLRRKGYPMSRHRAFRLWRLAGLQLPRRRPRRRVASSRPQPLPPTAPNHVWAYDFVVRRLRQWPAVEVPDRHRRIHPGGFGDRRRRLDPLQTPHSGTGAPDLRPRRPALSAFKQWLGVRQPRDSGIDRPGPGNPTKLLQRSSHPVSRFHSLARQQLLGRR